jgi:hypothetical protein
MIEPMTSPSLAHAFLHAVFPARLPLQTACFEVFGEL